MNERLSAYLLGELDPAARRGVRGRARARPGARRGGRAPGDGRDAARGARARRVGSSRGARARAAVAAPATARRRRRRVLALRPLVAAALAFRPARDRPRRPGCSWAAATSARAAARSSPSTRSRRSAAARTAPPGWRAPTAGARRSSSAGSQPSNGGDFYELWLLNSPDDLVSLGSFRVPASGDVDVTVPLPADPDRFAALDVSVEPPDGNPAHSSRSVLRAPLS